MSSKYGGDAHNDQYCKIIQWIKHHKDHGDPKYAEAISDLCLESVLSPSKYPGLTFLYQTNKKIRKDFCDKVFTPDSREACEEFKRYILPDVFHSCDDFQKKDVGNVLGYKYTIKSCDKNKVVFDNGMEIHSLLHHNSYEPLNAKLKDIIKIYYVVKGEPPESGDTYRIHHRQQHNKSNRGDDVVGGGPGEAMELFTNSGFKDILESPLNLSCGFDAFDECLDYLTSMEETPVVKNLILIQWYSCSTPHGIISYMLCIILLAFIIPSGEINKDIFSELISKIIKKLRNGSTCSSNYILRKKSEFLEKLSVKSRFNRSNLSTENKSKIENFASSLSLRENNENLIQILLNKIQSADLWGGCFPKLIDGDNFQKISIIMFVLTVYVYTAYAESSDRQIDAMGVIISIFEQMASLEIDTLINEVSTNTRIISVIKNPEMIRMIAGDNTLSNNFIRSHFGDEDMDNHDMSNHDMGNHDMESSSSSSSVFGGGRGRSKKNKIQSVIKNMVHGKNKKTPKFKSNTSNEYKSIHHLF